MRRSGQFVSVDEYDDVTGDALYRKLDAARIVETLDVLGQRISERFSGSGLSKVAADLSAVAHATAERAERLARPYLWLRGLIALFLIAGVAAQLFFIKLIRLEDAHIDAVSLAQGLESAVNLLLLMAAAIWFLLTLEERLKRRGVLEALHELRSLAHVVDMHQLTKDPTILLQSGPRTASSPTREMSEFELTRYLEYCAEMLALIGKLAALYAERAKDPVIVEAVNDIESLTTNLGRKTWQKIMILKQLTEAGA